jgi:hypothetical protein
VTRLKQLLQRLSPATATSLLTAALTCAAAFGAPVTKAQQASILVFGGALALILFAHGLSNALKYLTPQTIVGLVAAAIGVAIAFGMPLTKAQSDQILNLTGLLSGLLLFHGMVHTVARDRRAPSEQKTGGVARVFYSLNVDGNKKYKGGRLPAFRPPGLKTFLEYATKTKLPKPPATFKAPAGPYPIDGNDEYGDCTIAGVAHAIAAWNRLYSQKDRVPAQQTIIRLYLKLTGGQDSGLVEANVLQAWRKTGLFGHKIWGYAPVKITDPNAIKLAISGYGGSYLGIKCPESAQRQFSEGKPWTYEGEQTEDGHCVVALGYDAEGNLECATWGGIALLTPGFLKHYLEEAWVILSDQLVKAGKDTVGLDLAALEQDLASV